MNLLSPDETCQLRDEHYNATLIEVVEVHDELRILRVQPDAGLPELKPGQYSSLGVGYWEPRVPNVEHEEVDERHLRRMIKRAYSFSCSLLAADGRLVRARDCPYFEFYIALIRHGEKHPPALTPRLFALQRGDRLFIDHRVNGHYTLDAVGPADDVLLLATGTGEAPHNAMLAELLFQGHAGRVVSATCARYRRDLAYASPLGQLESRHENFRYLALTTREPENVDSSRSDFVGKQHLQDYVASGELERASRLVLDPSRVRVFLCGNPAMIGAPDKHAATDPTLPVPGGMLALLAQRGFRIDEPHRPGNVHFERYWL